jgi:hypothetical protein
VSWINGRFYANPLFGRALERARIAEPGRIWSEEYPKLEQRLIPQTQSGNPAPRTTGTEPGQREQDGHWVTIDHRHVLIQEHSAAQKIAAHLKARKVDKIYNEFSGLRPKPGVTTVDDLNRARRNAAHVYHNMRGKGFQGPSTLGPGDARDIKVPGTPAAQGYQSTKDAIAAAAQEPDTTQNANHVYLYDPELLKTRGIHYPDWVTQGQTTTIAGPFINESGGGDVAKGHEVYIIPVNDRNMRHPDE